MNALYRIEDQLLQRSGLAELGRAIIAQRNLLLFAGLMLVLAYGYEIFNFSLRIDSEWYGAGFGVKPVWLEQGRWGMYWLSHWLLPDSVMPVVPSLIAVAGLAVGGLLWLASMPQRTAVQAYFTLAFIISCPIYYFIVYFTILGFGVGIACALSGLANYLLFKKTWQWSWITISCYTLAIGTYQALVPLIAVMFGTVLLQQMIHRNGEWRLFVMLCCKFILCLMVAALLSTCLAWLFAEDVGRDFSYIQSHNKLQWQWDYFTNAASDSWHAMLKYYLGDATYYLYKLETLAVVFGIGLAIVLGRLCAGVSGITWKLVALVLLCLIVITPMGLLIVGNGEMPPRTQLSIIWVLAGVIFISLGVRSLLLRSFLICLLLPLIYQFIVTDNRYSFMAKSQWQADKALSLLVISEIQRQGFPPEPERGRVRLEIVGVPEFKQIPSLVKREAIGASQYVWDGGRAERVRFLYDFIGFNEFWAANIEQRRKLMSATVSMPNWPQAGSVKIIDDVVVVKFSDYSQGQLLEICGDDMKCDK